MSISDISRAELPEQHVAVVEASVAHDGIAQFIGGAFQEVATVVAQQGLQFAGPPFARYRMDEGDWEVEAGFPVSAPVRPEGRVRPGTLPGGSVARVVYRGPYQGLAEAYEALERSVRDSGDHMAGPPWEAYLDEPDVAEPRTEVFAPVASGTSA
jgi:effector-binding domain-containing protein